MFRYNCRHLAVKCCDCSVDVIATRRTPNHLHWQSIDKQATLTSTVIGVFAGLGIIHTCTVAYAAI